MSSKFGGGGASCTICTKTVYPAETLQFDKKPYHVDCFRCQFVDPTGDGSACNKKMSASDAAVFENELLCKQCFRKGNYAQKQKKISWTKKESTGTNPIASKFGGGGVSCTICEKTVYSAEMLQFDKKSYHGSCFKCKTCSKVMTASGAAQFDGELFCTKCFGEGGYRQKQAATASSSGGSAKSNALASKFGGGGNKCVRCDKTVYPAETVSHEKQFYHADCFTCSAEDCRKKLTPSSAEGKKAPDGTVTVYCKKCFMSLGLNRADVRKAE